MGPKVPFLKDGVLNLLKVIDLPRNERHELINMGYGELMLHHGAQLYSDTRLRDEIDLAREEADTRRASKISFTFIKLKTPLGANELLLPRKIYIKMRFFTFPELRTDQADLTLTNT
jgi:hypothetical protein